MLANPTRPLQLLTSEYRRQKYIYFVAKENASNLIYVPGIVSIACDGLNWQANIFSQSFSFKGKQKDVQTISVNGKMQKDMVLRTSP